ncbi:glycosyltransferase family 2 protein [Algibacter sp. L1A34]|uniref:glycosyltransferase family 2 protein n=1 Tax=Algibacter sp. L1A34 TaxID=2686365 RepID=UPI00131AE4EF|nr:glycosyltransferase family 2 protein [Algibacter sp. L1A34]
MIKSPDITIIMATYNRAHFILEMLNTISKQTFKSWECIIIDDGGTDNTEAVISNLLIEDSRFKFLKRTDKYEKGLCGSRNYGLDLAKGDYIIFFDDDDLVHPKNLEIAHHVITNNSVDFCHYQKQSFVKEKPTFLDSKVEVIGNIATTNIEAVVTGEIGLASCTVLWKNDCLKTIRFNENLQYAEEWECYINIISHGFKGLIISNILYYNRKHANSNTGEFWSNNPKRIDSKKEAIYLVIQNLKTKQLLSNSIARFLINTAIHFRDVKYFRKMVSESNVSLKGLCLINIKYYLFPFWKIKQKVKKTTKK